MRDILIESWDQLHAAMFEDVWDPSILRYRNDRVYRGMSDSVWELTPRSTVPARTIWVWKK